MPSGKDGAKMGGQDQKHQHQSEPPKDRISSSVIIINNPEGGNGPTLFTPEDEAPAASPDDPSNKRKTKGFPERRSCICKQ